MAESQTVTAPQQAKRTPQKKLLDANTTLNNAVLAYHDYMLRQGFSEHTVKAFAGDLRLLQKFFDGGMAISRLGTKELNNFLMWLLHDRNVPCSPKSYSRRVTTLKSFFGWLAGIKVIPTDPASALVHHRVRTPLPQFLGDEDVEKLIDAADQKMTAKGDPRPYLLVHLILQTGMKKSECVGIALSDIDRKGEEPAMLIRYSNPRMQHKERRLHFAKELLPVIDKYLDKYQPTENLFECTPRNLEYVLADVSREAGLPEQVSFEMLRWTSAVRDFRDGMDPDRLRLKMGLSKITWRETSEKLAKLAGPIDHECLSTKLTMKP